jgi:hypothetical protein
VKLGRVSIPRSRITIAVNLRSFRVSGTVAGQEVWNDDTYNTMFYICKGRPTLFHDQSRLHQTAQPNLLVSGSVLFFTSYTTMHLKSLTFVFILSISVAIASPQLRSDVGGPCTKDSNCYGGANCCSGICTLGSCRMDGSCDAGNSPPNFITIWYCTDISRQRLLWLVPQLRQRKMLHVQGRHRGRVQMYWEL